MSAFRPAAEQAQNSEEARERIRRLRGRVRAGMLLVRIHLGLGVLLLVMKSSEGRPWAMAALGAAMVWFAWPWVARRVDRLRERAEERIAPDPTRGWSRTVFRPTVDLDRSALEGVALGEPIAGLAGFGRADDPRAARLGALVWSTIGVDAEEDDGRLEGFALSWEEGFRGKLLLAGQELPLGARSDEAAITAALGPPTRREQDPDEVVLYYSRANGVEWQVELPAGRTLAMWRIVRFR